MKEQKKEEELQKEEAEERKKEEERQLHGVARDSKQTRRSHSPACQTSFIHVPV